MSEETHIPETAALAAIAQAVTGPETPAAATVKSAPDWKASWALVLAGPAISLLIIAGCAAGIWILWPDAVRLRAIEVMRTIVIGLFSVIGVLAAILAIVTFRLASGGLKRIDARAGPAGLTIETGQ